MVADSSLLPTIRSCALSRTTANRHPVTTRSTSTARVLFPHCCLDPACCLDPLYPFTIPYASCPRGGIIGCVSPEESNPSMQGRSLPNFLRQQCCQTYRYDDCIHCIDSGRNTMPTHYHEELRAFLKGAEIPIHQTRPQTSEYGRSKHRIYL